VAVVGASPRATGPRVGGNGYIESSISLGIQGKIFPVHPSAESILGFKSYRSVQEIPEAVDLAILCIPYSAVLPVMQGCVDKGVKFVHIFAAGFSETGRKENTETERQLIKLAQKGGIRLVGPNCLGVYCPEGGLAWRKYFPKEPGPFAFVSQSGQLAEEVIKESMFQGLRFSKVISFGNAGDLQCHDFLDYLARDDKTKIIGLYLEGLKDGRAFSEVVRDLTRKKPLVVWKGGQSEGGSKATVSHTAAIAGSPEIWQALCRQSGIISVNSSEELIFTVSALQKYPLPRGPNVAILVESGGTGVTMADTAERGGLKVPRLSERTLRGLEEFVPFQGSNVRNPLDMMSSLFDKENFRKLITLLRDDPVIDTFIFSITQLVDRYNEIGGRPFLDGTIRMTIEGARELNKPFFVVFGKARSLEGAGVRQDVMEKYHLAGIAAFPSLQMAVRVIANMVRYRGYLCL